MASPTVVSTAETAVTTAGTSHAITLPASIASTDLVLITMDIGSTSATVNALANWTEILDEASANGLKIIWYTGAGVPSNPTFVTSASTRSATIAWRISGANKSITPEIGTTATGTSATPDPPAITPTGGSKDYLFIAMVGMAGEEADDDTWANTPPTNYTPSPPLQIACGIAGTNLGGLQCAASRQLTASTDNPGTFGVDVSAAWRAQTIAVHPDPTAIIPLATAAAVSTASLSLTAQTTIALGTSAALSTASLALTAKTTIALSAATAVSTASLTPDTNYYKNNVLADSPLLYWRLGEPSGTVLDSSGNGHTGTANSVTRDITGALNPAYDDGAIDFNGTDSYISADSSYNPWSGLTAFSVEAWVKTDNYTAAGNDAILGSLGTNPQLVIQATGTMSFVYNGLSQASWAVVWPGDGQWVHVVMNFDTNSGGAASELYLNSVLQTGAGTHNAFGATGTFSVGARGAGPAAFIDGQIDEVALYTSYLSSTRVTAHYNIGKVASSTIPLSTAVATSTASLSVTIPLGRYGTAVKTLGPSLYYRLNDSGSTITDSTGNLNHGTANSSYTNRVSGNTSDDPDNKAISLDGASDALSGGFVIADSYAPFPPNAIRTVAFMVKINSDQAHMVNLFCDRNTTVGNDSMVIEITPGLDNVRYYGDVNADFPSFQDWPYQFLTGRWYHIVVWFDDTAGTLANQLKLFINGVSQGAPSVGSTGVIHHFNTGGVSRPFQFGRRDGATNTEYIDADYDEVAIFEYKLSDANVATLWAAALSVPLSAAVAVSSANLALTAKTTIALDTSVAVSTASLALTAKTTIPLGTSAATSTTSLNLTAQTTIPLGTAAATSTASLSLTTKTAIPLSSAVSVSTASLSLSALTTIPLGTSASVSTASLSLTAQTLIALGTATSISTASLALTAKTTVVLGTSAAISTAALSVTTTTQIPLSTATAISTAALNLSAKTLIPLDTSVAVSTASLSLTTQTLIPLGTSVAISTASLTLSAQTVITLGTSASISTTSLDLTTKTTIPLDTSIAVSTASLSLSAKTLIALGTSASVSTASLALTAATLIPLSSSDAISTASLDVSVGITEAVIPLGTSVATSTTSLILTVPGVIVIEIGQVEETNFVPGILIVSKALTVGQTLETESANSVTPLRAISIGVASDTEEATALSSSKTVQILQASANNLAGAITPVRAIVLSQVSETDETTPISVSKALGINTVLEIDLAQSFLQGQHFLIGQVQETDLAQGITRRAEITNVYYPAFENVNEGHATAIVDISISHGFTVSVSSNSLDVIESSTTFTNIGNIKVIDEPTIALAFTTPSFNKTFLDNPFIIGISEGKLIGFRCLNEDQNKDIQSVEVHNIISGETVVINAHIALDNKLAIDAQASSMLQVSPSIAIIDIEEPVSVTTIQVLQTNIGIKEKN